MNHNPPWEAEKHRWDSDGKELELWDVVNAADRPSDRYYLTEDPDEETVRLWAAAPELLAACRAALALLATLGVNGEVAVTLAAAVSKAEFRAG